MNRWIGLLELGEFFLAQMFAIRFPTLAAQLWPLKCATTAAPSTPNKDTVGHGRGLDQVHLRLKLVKKFRINAVCLDWREAQFNLLQHFNKFVAVNQLNRRNSIAQCLSFGFGCE